MGDIYIHTATGHAQPWRSKINLRSAPFSDSLAGEHEGWNIALQ